MDYDPDKVRAHKDDFTYFPGYVDPHLLGVSQCDSVKRFDFLGELGIRKEVAELTYDYKMRMERSKNLIEFVTKHAVEWLLDHEEFHDCLIED